jgi:hypothetical protein
LAASAHSWKSEASSALITEVDRANLDVLLHTDTEVVGVESNLTEPLREHDPVKWRPPYHDPKMATLLAGGWRNVFAAALAGSWQPRT